MKEVRTATSMAVTRTMKKWLWIMLAMVLWVTSNSLIMKIKIDPHTLLRADGGIE